MGAESDLVYLRARYYDPATQQFISRDPMEGATGQPYTYANSNPTNMVDPDGHIAWFVAFAWMLAGNIGWDVGSSAASALMSGGDFDLVGSVVGSATSWSTYLPVVKPAKVFGFARKAVKGENAYAKFGRRVHNVFSGIVTRKGWQSEPELIDPKTGKTVKPDAMTPSGHAIELKPNTPRGRREGRAQIRKYERATGKPGRVIYYESPFKP